VFACAETHPWTTSGGIRMVTDRCVTRYTDSLFTVEAGKEEIGDVSV
jgi:hypothetical protein